MWRLFGVIITGCLVSGCFASSDQAQDQKCRSYGAAPGSQEYFQCRMALNQLAARQGSEMRAAIQAVDFKPESPVFTPIPITHPSTEVRCQSKPNGIGGMETVCR